MVLGNLIGGFITILVGVTLVPTVADLVFAANNINTTATNTTVTSASSSAASILSLTTLFFALGITASGIAVAAQALRSAGLLGL